MNLIINIHLGLLKIKSLHGGKWKTIIYCPCILYFFEKWGAINNGFLFFPWHSWNSQKSTFFNHREPEVLNVFFYTYTNFFWITEFISTTLRITHDHPSHSKLWFLKGPNAYTKLNSCNFTFKWFLNIIKRKKENIPICYCQLRKFILSLGSFLQL